MPGKGTISDYEEEVWDPVSDALARIESAKVKIENAYKVKINIEGWQVAGKEDASWIITPSDKDRKVSEFSTLLTKVVGRCTAAFIEEMGERPKDRWLMSLFVHLFLNSICCHATEEREIRDFPYY